MDMETLNPKERQTSLRIVLLRMVLLPTLGVAIVLIGMLLFSANTLREELIEGERNLVQAVAQQSNGYVAETRQVMLTLAYVILTLDPDEQLALLTQSRINYPRFSALYLLDGSGHVVMEDTDNLSLLNLDLTGESFFKEAKDSRKPFFSEPFVSPTTGQISLTGVIPIYEGDTLQAMLVGELNLETLQQVIESIQLGDQAIAFLMDREGTLIAHPNTAWVQQQHDLRSLPIVQDARLGNTDTLDLFYDANQTTWFIGTSAYTPNDWLVIITQPAWIAIGPLINLVVFSALVLLISLAMFLVAQLFNLRRITQPISNLVEDANQLATGNYHILDSPTKDSDIKEITSLQQGFISMAEAVQERDRYLEHRVAERTERLELVAALSERLSGILDLDALLKAIVNQIKGALNYYHAHIYLLDEASNVLIVVEGTGKAGAEMKRHGHSIALNAPTSLVAQAARYNQIVRMDNVRNSPTWLPNKLLPNTQSEIAVPIMLESQVVGVLDVQSDKVAGLDEGDESLLRSLANQAAIAIKNARLLTERQTTIKRLEEVDEAKSRFITMISHELRTPLNAINGFAELLLFGLSGDISDEAKNDVQLIHNNGKHLSTLINGIIDITQMEKEETTINIEVVDAAETVQEVMAETSSLVMDKSVELVSEIAPNLPNIMADPTRLRQILLNLLSNAIKFTSKGEVRVIVNQATEQPDSIKFTVLDTGIGIDAKQVETIFELFQQADMSDARQYGGLGVGLSTSKLLVGLHGGEIGVQSEEGVGSEFWFTMPMVTGE